MASLLPVILTAIVMSGWRTVSRRMFQRSLPAGDGGDRLEVGEYCFDEVVMLSSQVAVDAEVFIIMVGTVPDKRVGTHQAMKTMLVGCAAWHAVRFVDDDPGETAARHEQVS